MSGTGLIHHLAEVEHWAAARVSGEYRRSTLGRSLEEEGFVHCAAPEQVADVLRRYYSTYPRELVLLSIDPGRLTSPLRWEVGGSGTGDRFPHVHGPITTDAVISTAVLHPPFG
ncbi:MAG TPA: DUF952 domain-containing protein [Ornithinibacter sp.]|nr:DUF952 domain-containing protein [Ornithinibacter sp.]